MTRLARSHLVCIALLTIFVALLTCWLEFIHTNRFSHLSQLAANRSTEYAQDMKGNDQEITIVDLNASLSAVEAAARADLPHARERWIDSDDVDELTDERGTLILIQTNGYSPYNDSFRAICTIQLNAIQVATVKLQHHGQDPFKVHPD